MLRRDATLNLVSVLSARTGAARRRDLYVTRINAGDVRGIYRQNRNGDS